MSPQFFIRRPRFAFVISIVITLMGLLAIKVMPVDQYPDIAAPKVVVMTNYPGANAETVKDTVATPIENQVNGAEGMVYMSSQCGSDGSYSLTVTFEIGIDADMAQVDVQNRVALAEPLLPVEVKQRGVKVRKRSSDMLMVVNLFSPDNRFDGLFLSNYATLSVISELSRLPGIGEAKIIGALDYGMRIWLDPVKLTNEKLSVNHVIGAIKEQNAQAAIGQLGGAPNPDDTQFQYVLSTKGRLASPEEFGGIILKADESGSVIHLRDVARIELGAQGYKGYGEYNNNPGVLMAVYKLSDANSLDVAETTREKMEELKHYFPEGIDYAIGHDTTEFIKESLHETVLTLFFTIALVIGVTYIFLGNIRATLIPTIAVPVSIIGTLAVLYFMGMTINTVTLFALILAIGVVVDDAIIVVENVERLMEEEHLAPRAATEKAMKEVAGPIIATSLVLAAVFGPTMLLPGITGRMFSQFGATLVIAVLISAVNAMTLSPALAATLLKEGEHKPNILIRLFNRFFGVLTGIYVKIVGWLARHVIVSLVLIAALFGSLYYMFTIVPTSFIPEEDKGFFMVDVSLPDAASLNRTEVIMDQITELLKKDPAMETVLSVNGVSILNKALQSNAGLVIAKLKPWGERKDPAEHQFALQKKYQQLFSQMPEVRTLVFGAPAIPGLGAMAGFSFVLEDTQGQGVDAMAAALQQLIKDANARPEIARAFSTFRPASPQLYLELNRTTAKTLSVNISDIFLTLQTLLGGLYVNDFNLFGQTYKVMLQADSPFRQKETDISQIYVSNRKGELVPLSGVASLVPSRGPDVLYRYNTYDSVTINGIPNAAAGYSSGDAMSGMEAVSNLPSGYKFEWTGSSYEERKSGNMAPIALGLSIIFTVLFLAALYESFLTPLAIILSVPVAMIGALAADLLMKEPLSLYGQIGLVLLLGLATKTAILIVEFGKNLRERDELSLQEATVQAARLRFRPVIMTSSCFIAGVFPLVIASGAGAASRISLGLTVFGGSIMLAFGGTLLVPIFFRLIQGLREIVHRGPTVPPE